MTDQVIELTNALVFCEDCKHLKNTSLKSAYTNNVHGFFCNCPANQIPKDKWLRKRSLTNGPQQAPWEKNINNDCKDFELLRK